MEKVQPGIYRKDDYLYTVNSNPGEKVYGEPLIQEGQEFRRWDPERSKAAAAILNGLELGLESNSTVLYLGAASGTTVSHLSDILREGFIYAVEYSETTIKDLLKLAEARENIAPILGDARNPGDYSEIVSGKVDVVYQDVSQRDQAEIFLRNCEEYLKEDGIALITIKAQSVSASRDAEEIFGEVKQKLEERMEIIDEKRLEPYETDHLFVKLKKKS